MPKGINKRQRRKRAQQANESNLHKAQFGKASAFALPAPAPSGPADLAARLPASLRKMMALKEVAAKDEARKAARKHQHELDVATPAPPATVDSRCEHPTHDATRAQAHPQQEAPTPWGPNPTAAVTESQEPLDAVEPSAAAASKKQNRAQREQPDKLYLEGAFDQQKKKRLKESKRQFLERKRLAKKGGQQAGGNLADGATSSELKLKLRAVETQARFGEVADAPLKVQLKRKHWATKQEREQKRQQAADDGQPQGLQNAGPPGRLAKIFQSQMAAATQRMRQQQVVQAKRVNKASGLVAAAAAAEQERMRASVVEAYRQRKKGGVPSVGGANMASLAELVERGAATAAAMSALR